MRIDLPLWSRGLNLFNMCGFSIAAAAAALFKYSEEILFECLHFLCVHLLQFLILFTRDNFVNYRCCEKSS